MSQRIIFSNLTFKWLGDSAVMYQSSFQDPATTTMEGIYLFNIHLLFVIIGIVVFVAWLLLLVLINFTKSNILEIVWTSIPALILLSLASLSLPLLSINNGN